MSDSFKKLQSHMQQKRVFHGSPVANLKLLEPRPASDVDKLDTFNNDTAVFASDNFCMSIVFGLVDLNKVALSRDACSWSAGPQKSGRVTEIISRIPEQWRKYIENEAVGYVYVFSQQAFLETDGIQWKSKIAVEPIDCIQVTLKDFYEAGGKIEWMSAKDADYKKR